MHIIKTIVFFTCLGAHSLLWADTVTAQQSPTFDCWDDGVHLNAVQDAFPDKSTMDAWVMKGVLDNCSPDPETGGNVMTWSCGNIFYSETCHVMPYGPCSCFGMPPLFSGNACAEQTEPIAERAWTQYLTLILNRQLLRKRIKLYLNALKSGTHSEWDESRLRRKIRTGMSLLTPTQIMIYEAKRIIRELASMRTKFEQGHDLCTRIDNRITKLTEEVAKLERRQEHYFELSVIYAATLP